MFIPNLTQANECFKIASGPVFLSDENHLKLRLKKFKQTFPAAVKLFYALKANYNSSLIQCLRENGLDGVDTVSPYEIQLAQKIGFKSNEIIYTGCAANDDELRFVHAQNILLNIGSIHELSRFAKLFPKSSVSLRLNPGFGDGENEKVITAGDISKFGIAQKEYAEALNICKDHQINIVGLHLHLGSGLYKSQVFDQALDFILPLARQQMHLKFVDLGGGFGVPHHRDTTPIKLEDFANDLKKKLSTYDLNSIEIRFEPGKYLVAESTALLCKINVIKHFDNTQLIVLNTGFNHLIRPAFYQSYHEILNLSQMQAQQKTLLPSKIEGYLCESSDVFNPKVNFPQSKEGDVIAILSAGAYCSSMSSLYNFRPYAAEALLKEDGSIICTRQPLNFDQLYQSMGWVDQP